MTRSGATGRQTSARWRLLATAILGIAAIAADPSQRPLRVGTSGDYAPFSIARGDGTALEGFDIALARAFAADRGRPLELVRFGWPDLAARLTAHDFDVAMSGVTVRPDRSLLGRFTTPVAESGALVLVRRQTGSSLDDLNRPDVRLAVNAGGHLERAARERFPLAALAPVPRNSDVLGELLAGRADGAVTDTMEAPDWMKRAPGLVALGPFTRDRKAWLVRAEEPELAAELDAWLARKEADGTLAALRAQWLPGAAAPRTAAPLPALVAALDERLSLMGFVADAKRAAGKAVRDPSQEERVLQAALVATRKAAASTGRPAPSEACVRGLFAAQMAAGRALQETALAQEPRGLEKPPDLQRQTRPALARLTPRIAAALAALPTGLGEQEIAEALQEGIRSAELEEPQRAALRAAISRCVQPADRSVGD
jgi:cyclohexadienyl dehydratase